jgi:hypothetical protein
MTSLIEGVQEVLRQARENLETGPAPMYYRHDEAKAWKAGSGYTIETFYQTALAYARGLPTVDLPSPQEPELPTNVRDREKLTAARRAGIGRTLIPRDAGWSAQFDIGGRQAERPEYLDHVRETMLRKLYRAVEDAGISTTLDIVRLNVGEREHPGMYGGPALRWVFPRPYPDTGDPARVDGGEHHGQHVEVTATWEQLALLGEDVAMHFYNLAGFDAGTGQWIYRPAGDRR